MPLEYITKKAYFFKSEFFVDQRVLIPRSETEVLVEIACQEISEVIKHTDESVRIADIGVGSGAIALSILQEIASPLFMTGLDLSLDALKVARKNWFKLRYQIHPSSDFRLIQSDRLAELEAGEKFHVIVSNPPYIKKSEDSAFVHSQVDSFEPHVALYLEDEEYDNWFGLLATQVSEHLLSEGVFFMEGHEDHWEDLEPIFRSAGFETQLINDLTGATRFLRAKKVVV